MVWVVVILIGILIFYQVSKQPTVMTVNKENDGSIVDLPSDYIKSLDPTAKEIILSSEPPALSVEGLESLMDDSKLSVIDLGSGIIDERLTSDIIDVSLSGGIKKPSAPVLAPVIIPAETPAETPVTVILPPPTTSIIDKPSGYIASLDTPAPAIPVSTPATEAPAETPGKFTPGKYFEKKEKKAPVSLSPRRPRILIK